MLLLIVLPPLAGFACLRCCAGRMSGRAAAVAGSIPLIGALLASMLVVVRLVRLPPSELRVLEQKIFTWFEAGPLTFDWILRVDPLSACLVLVVAAGGAVAHLVVSARAAADGWTSSAVACLGLLATGMLLLGLAGNLMVMIVAWNMVLLSTALLVGSGPGHRNGPRAIRLFGLQFTGAALLLFAVSLAIGTSGGPDLLRITPTTIAVPAWPDPDSVAFLVVMVSFAWALSTAVVPIRAWLPRRCSGPHGMRAILDAAAVVAAGYVSARLSGLVDEVPTTRLLVAGCAFGWLLFGWRTAAALEVLVRGPRVRARLIAIWRVIDIDATVVGVGSVIQGWGTLIVQATRAPARLHVLLLMVSVVVIFGYLLWQP